MSEERPSARVDLVTAAVWIALAGAIAIGSWTMDRLERLGAPLYAAPGLVPGLLGLLLLVLGVLLGARAVREGGLHDRRVNASLKEGWRGTTLVLALCLGYAVGLVGHVPFWLATFLFVTAFIAVFEYPRLRNMAFAPLYGAGTSLAVTYLFESVFLVRLP
jgi:hypothetical protein